MTATLLRIPNRAHEAAVKIARERVGLPINIAPPAWRWAQEKRP